MAWILVGTKGVFLDDFTYWPNKRLLLFIIKNGMWGKGE